MLVLSRKQGERIVVGGNIEIILTEIGGNRVRIGINAPPEVSIRRAEIADSATGTTSEFCCLGSVAGSQFR